MAEYIERGEFIKSVKDIPMWGSVAAMLADSIPAADVAPVVHARWIKGPSNPYCSECFVECRTKLHFVQTVARKWIRAKNNGDKVDLCSYGKPKEV